MTTVRDDLEDAGAALGSAARRVGSNVKETATVAARKVRGSVERGVESVEETAEAAGETVSDAGSSVRNGAQKLWDFGRELIAQARENAAEAASDLGEDAHDVASDARAGGRVATKSLKGMLRAHPLRSIAVIGIAGLVVGKLLGANNRTRTARKR
jgi:ElaB/YqjD/DUF883 family membrane-anchored ribosome-binding protein